MEMFFSFVKLNEIKGVNHIVNFEGVLNTLTHTQLV